MHQLPKWQLAILVGLSSLVLSWSGCREKHIEKLVLPDSKELRPAIKCVINEQDELAECMLDPSRVTIDLGYLRNIIDLLDACRKARI